MPVPSTSPILRLAYPLGLIALAATAWAGPTFVSGFWGVRLPLLDPLGNGSLANAAWVWGPALGICALVHARLAMAGAPRGSQAIPYLFLLTAATFAGAAWLTAPGMAATLLASFARLTGILLLGSIAVGLTCVDDDIFPGDDLGERTADVVALVQPEPAARHEMPVALAA